MGIPVRIRTYKNSILATLVSLFGSILDGLCKLLALAFLFGMISESGFFPGIIFGVIGFVVCVMIGAVLQGFIDKLAQHIALKKLANSVRNS